MNLIVDFCTYLIHAFVFGLGAFLIFSVPTAVLVFVNICFAPERGNKLSYAGSSVLTLVSLILSIAYMGWVWPFGQPDVQPIDFYKNTTTYLYQKSLRSFAEYQQDLVEDEPSVEINKVRKIGRFKVTDWNPPKHVYVSLQDLETGTEYNGLYVSKHCSHSPKLGEQINLRYEEFTLSKDPTGRVNRRFTNLYTEFCT